MHRNSGKMLQTTQAVILNCRKKGDNSSLVETYTQEQGRVDFMVFGNKWKSTLQPMAVVEISYQQTPTRTMGTITEVTRTFVPQNQDMPHQCMALFMAEIIEKSLRLPLTDETLFNWLTNSIKKLDQMDELSNFAAEFMAQLSTILGYGGAVLDEWRDLKSLDIIQTIQ